MGAQFRSCAFRDGNSAVALEAQLDFAVVRRVVQTVGDELHVFFGCEETAFGDHVAHAVTVAQGIGGEGFQLIVHVIPTTRAEQNEGEHDGDGLRAPHHVHEGHRLLLRPFGGHPFGRGIFGKRHYLQFLCRFCFSQVLIVNQIRFKDFRFKDIVLVNVGPVQLGQGDVFHRIIVLKGEHDRFVFGVLLCAVAALNVSVTVRFGLGNRFVFCRGLERGRFFVKDLDAQGFLVHTRLEQTGEQFGFFATCREVVQDAKRLEFRHREVGGRLFSHGLTSPNRRPDAFQGWRCFVDVLHQIQGL